MRYTDSHIAPVPELIVVSSLLLSVMRSLELLVGALPFFSFGDGMICMKQKHCLVSQINLEL